MSSTLSPVWWIAGAAAGVAAFAYWRRRAKPVDDKQGRIDAAVEACKALGIPEIACRAGAGPVLSVVDQRPQEENDAANGAPELLAGPVNVAARMRGGGSRDFFPVAVGGIWDGGQPVARYANGCVPFAGHPDFAKCAPGTHDMRGDYPADATGPIAGNRYLTGRPWGTEGGDPLTRKVKTNADGSEEWFFKGAPLVCPPGTTVDPRKRDHRPGASPCQVPSSNPVAVPPSVGDWEPSPRPPVDTNNSRYRWVASPAPGRWERA